MNNSSTSTSSTSSNNNNINNDNSNETDRSLAIPKLDKNKPSGANFALFLLAQD